MKQIEVEIQKVNPNAHIPRYMTEGSVGLDVCACIDTQIVLKPNEVKSISTGLVVGIPDGYEIQVRSRSGLSLKNITVHNSPGTIDTDFIGEIKVILKNSSIDDFIVNNGDRIAQLVLNEVPKISFKEVNKLTKTTERGEFGFGSTGIN